MLWGNCSWIHVSSSYMWVFRCILDVPSNIFAPWEAVMGLDQRMIVVFPRKSVDDEFYVSVWLFLLYGPYVIFRKLWNYCLIVLAGMLRFSFALLYGTVWIVCTSVSSGIFQKQSIVCCILTRVRGFLWLLFCDMSSLLHLCSSAHQ